ncbi:hypothetical protein ZWY2020_025202 [Hordeum vulgare]|nr:hypothetical protein ZWY2020_025202 [Hordeum vulgare]
MINAELAKLRDEMVKVQRDAEAEAAWIETRRAQITAETARLNTENWHLERHERASDVIHQRRHQGRLPPDLNPTRLFDTPRTPEAGTVPGGGPAQPPNPPLQPAVDRVPRFHMPEGHFSNPVDNVLAATRHLESLPIYGNTPAEIEARNTIEMLKTAVVQNAQFSHSLDWLHSTPQVSHTRSQPEDQPAITSGPRHLSQGNPPDHRYPPIRNTFGATGQDHQDIQTGPAPLSGGGRQVAVPCLAPVLRNERMPNDFKGPRKVPNYTPDLEQASWVESYEIAMDMLDVSEAVCAKYFKMMLEGTARTWLKNLPPNSIQTWPELKERFVKNFRGTCKRPMTIVDLQHCVQRPDESAHHWTRRVAEIIHSSNGITAAQALLILEQNCHYEPLVQKLGRLKRKVQDMGELMDTLTRYAEAYDTKDPGEDGGKANSPRKAKSSKSHSRFQGCAHHNHGGNGKRRQQEGSTDFVANTNTNNGNQRQTKRGYSGKKPRNYNEILKGPCPHHAMEDGPATHSWEYYYVMQEFRAEAI